MTAFRILLVILLIAVTPSALAQDARFISARPSPLKQAGVSKPNETTFSGRVKIAGSFEVIWEPGSEGYPFRVLFRPDKPSREILPHDSQRGPVREIWLRNTDVALRAFLTPAQRKSLAAARSRQATGRATVILNSYRTGVDCDQRGYNALLVSVVRKPINVVTNAPAPESMDRC
ncbi:hypothetical protein GCM10027430_35340 [Lysobacter tyrosinilyticus]